MHCVTTKGREREMPIPTQWQTPHCLRVQRSSPHSLGPHQWAPCLPIQPFAVTQEGVQLPPATPLILQEVPISPFRSSSKDTQAARVGMCPPKIHYWKQPQIHRLKIRVMRIKQCSEGGASWWPSHFIGRGRGTYVLSLVLSHRAVPSAGLWYSKH